MNYVSVVYAVVTAIMLSYWFIRGKSTYRNRDERKEEAHVIERRVSIA